jgi:hypothetical protein
MARSYAQFSTSMWRNADFLALPSALQRVYMMLGSQADVSAVGVLHLSVTRWAGRAPDTTAADINRALDGLAARRFIVLDRDSEEVLLRAFLRWDNGYKNPKRQPAIKDAANDVESPAIVAALTVEFERVDMPQRYRGQCVRAADEAPDPAEPDPEPGSAFPQVDSLSIAIPENRDGVSSSERRVPQPPTHNPQPIPPSADRAAAPSQQPALDGMPEEEAPAETPEQTGWRLARRWRQAREAIGKPLIARGSKANSGNKDQVLMPLKNLIKGAVAAGYTEDEVNETLARCDQGIPAGHKFDQAIEKVREERRAGASMMPYNVPHQGGSASYSNPAPRSPADQRLADAQVLYAQYKAQEQEVVHG